MVVTCMAEGSMVLGFSDMLTLGGGGGRMTLISCTTLRTLNYGNYGLFLLMGNAGFIPSTV